MAAVCPIVFYEDWAGEDGLIERLLVGLPAEVAVVRLSLVGTQNGPGPEHTSRANHQTITDPRHTLGLV